MFHRDGCTTCSRTYHTHHASIAMVFKFQFRLNGVFALTETETEIDIMATVPNGIGVSVQYKHLRTILCKPFSVGIGLYQCERTVIVI